MAVPATARMTTAIMVGSARRPVDMDELPGGRQNREDTTVR
jgi:hypothetical protein